MKAQTSLKSGLAGGVALTVVHELLRHTIPTAPRMDLLGMQALSKLAKKGGKTPPNHNALFWITMAGDVAGNALYYSLAGVGKRRGTLLRGAVLGLSAGIGAVVLPKHLGLATAPSNRTVETKIMTVALYFFGGLVAAGTLLALQKKERKEMDLIF